MNSKRLRFLTLPVTFCLCLSLAAIPTYGETLKGVEILSGVWQGNPIEYLEGEILVGLQSGKTQQDFANELGSLPVEIVRAADQTGFMKLRAVKGYDLFTLIDQAAHLSSVRYAEPNMVDRLQVIPNDPNFSKQWHYHNTGQNPPGGTPDADIDAPEAWDITTGSSAVKVGVLDSGIPIQSGVLSHPDLDVASRYLFGWDYVNNDAIPADDRGHGTHVSGTIAAETNNSTGVAGVSWNAKILSIKVFNSSGSGSHSDFRDGCIYAADNGCKVINYSGGGSASSTKEWGVAYADTQGVVLCAAAGNGYSSSVIWPAAYSTSYSNTIAVSATDHNDVFSSYSNKGPEVTVAAPGGYGGTADANDVYSTMPNYWVTMNGSGYSQNYSFMAGTSMATPHVAGLAALILSIKPTITPDSVREIIKNTAEDLGSPGFDNYYGWGRINARQALGCCNGIRGNVDNDPADDVNVADLTFLVCYLFCPVTCPTCLAPSCYEEGDLNGDGDINVADLTYLVCYLFCPVTCPICSPPPVCP